MKVIHAEEAARLAGRAGLRRDDGSRGWRAWRRLVSACAAGNAAAQEAVWTAELREPDVLELLAAAPAEPADHAAYLVLIGQGAQHQALDPDGSLLAPAYRAAAPETRERLRTALAAEGDTEVIRVVVTGEQRDRLAEMSYDELAYLGHHLAERRSWDELRRLVRDLPLAKAAAAALLLPDGVSTASAPSPGQLRAVVERLPRRRLVRHDVTTSFEGASFSLDTSEPALRYRPLKRPRIRELHLDILRIDTGTVTRALNGDVLTDRDIGDSVLHLGDEILVRLKTRKDLHRIIRVSPDDEAVGPPAPLSVMRRSSGGAADFRAVSPRGERGRRPDAPDADSLGVPRFGPALSFLSPNSSAVHRRSSRHDEQSTHVWEFGPHAAPHLTGKHRGPIRKRWPLEEWRGLVLDDAFAARVHSAEGRRLDRDVPWLQADPKDPLQFTRLRRLLALSPGQDVLVTSPIARGRGFAVHSPHLPAARELLERPLLHATPADLQRIRELRNTIGAPDVQAALDLLSACLTDRIGGDIALDATDSGPFGGPHDLALGEEGKR
ncbi:hypothetical protein [Streptomyces sp. V4I2]|uniref:hypothetical protein n=1 Tax=Streptomyces sp. V4I2 TaxID=3042280 RepID=UPI00278AB927|nr:hypothetical protein [Streptomyces sp. V4I2]MDQ1042479.1 hypothetical protein [Streptomyces sp. V4I2]